MSSDLFRLLIPILVFMVLLLDIRKNMGIYKRSKRDIKKFEVARIFIIAALLISIVVGVFEILGKPLNSELTYYITIYNVLVLLIYLVFTRFKNFKRTRQE